MSSRAANILIAILATMFLLGLTMIAANSIKPVQVAVTTSTLWVRTTIPRTLTYVQPTTTTIVHVKDTEVEEVVHKPTPYPYQVMCEFSGTHLDSGDFIENLFVWGYDNKPDLVEGEIWYQQTRQAILDIMEGNPECDEEHERAIIKGSRPYMFAEADT